MTTTCSVLLRRETGGHHTPTTGSRLFAHSITTLTLIRMVCRGFGASGLNRVRSNWVILRLYFVDTPEEERVYADRIAEQTAYFGISADAALEVGNEASEFTKRTLAKPFTTYTRWRRAPGRSAN